MSGLPAGTVTFLFTDVEGSTRLWEEHPQAMREALARHDALVADAVQRHRGSVVKSRGEGDSLFSVFSSAAEGVVAALDAERAICAEPWPSDINLRIRAALHTGEAGLREGDYYGSAVNRCARVLALAHGGQILLSEVTASLVQDSLPPRATLRSHGLRQLRSLKRPEHIYQLLHPDLPETRPTLRSVAVEPPNLPTVLSSFVGRARELAELKELLESARLLTIAGPAGVGKTRLALQLAREAVDDFDDGAWWVALAPLTDPSLVPQAVASALMVREVPSRPLIGQLIDHVRPKSLLVVLDNCEHLVDACADLIGTLLPACPGLKIVLTSREVLNIAGEQTWRTPPLALPEPRDGIAIDHLKQAEAVQLFVQRARLVEHGFEATEQNGEAIARLCRHLDGNALAIELAAARTNVMSVEEILANLDDRFRLLAGGGRSAPPRQRTLRAALDWSHDLLSEPEQKLMGRLSMFAGGPTLASVQAVCTSDGIERHDVLDLLSQLVAKSLLQTDKDPTGSTRYRLLETIRQYYRERLAAVHDAAVHRRFADHFLALAEEAEPRLAGAEQVDWLHRIEAEHDDMRAALRWMADNGEDGLALRLVGALWRFWYRRGFFAEGSRQLSRVLGTEGARAETLERANALRGAGAFACVEGDFAAARSYYDESLAIFREHDDQPGIARALSDQAQLFYYQEDLENARALYEQSLEIKRELGDRHALANGLYNLGMLIHHRQVDPAAARPLYEEGLAIWKELENKRGIALVLKELGKVASDQGNLDEAESLWEESRALLRELGDRSGIGWLQMSLGIAQRERGERAAAHSLFGESLETARELGDRRCEAQALGYLAQLARQEGDWEMARRQYQEALAIHQEMGQQRELGAYLADLGRVSSACGDYEEAAEYCSQALGIHRETGIEVDILDSIEAFAGLAARRAQPRRALVLASAAAKLREANGTPMFPSEQRLLESELDQARQALGGAESKDAWSAGRRMTIEDVIAAALAGEDAE